MSFVAICSRARSLALRNALYFVVRIYIFIRIHVDARIPNEGLVFRIGLSNMGGPCAEIEIWRFNLSYDVDAQVVKDTVRFQHSMFQNQSGNLELFFI